MQASKGGSKSRRSSTFLGMTLSTCPNCLKLINARIEVEAQRVYFEKYCPDHGHSRALVSEDAEHYLKTHNYAQPGTIPRQFSTDVQKGCPHDCGLCPDHQQHTCHPIIEITEQCELNCPICIVNKTHPGFLPVNKFSKILETLIQAEGKLENITLSGGEPTLHPQFWEMVELTHRAEISRVSVATNGIRIAGDNEFCRRLKEHNVYVLLQFDGFDDQVYKSLRGKELLEIKELALANLERFGIAAQLLCTVTPGINDQQLGRIVELVLEKEHILSVVFQPAAVPAYLKGQEETALNRITIPGVIEALTAQTLGLLRKEDFIPLPCPNPGCVSLTYLLRLGDGKYIPFPRFVDMKKHLGLFSQSATIDPGPETEETLRDILNDLWSASGEVPDCDCITSALRRAMKEIFHNQSSPHQHMIRAAERQAKSIFIHHFMDPYTFDLGRVMKCCHHYPRPDGTIMPICTFNLFHRNKEENPFVT